MPKSYIYLGYECGESSTLDVNVADGKVNIQFNSAIHGMAFTREQTQTLIGHLQESLEELEEEENNGDAICEC